MPNNQLIFLVLFSPMPVKIYIWINTMNQTKPQTSYLQQLYPPIWGMLAFNMLHNSTKCKIVVWKMIEYHYLTFLCNK